MIQGERERRAQEAARRSGAELTAARLKAEEERLLQEEKAARELALGQENRQFLEELRIPEYLQSIIAEERLEESHVLWRTAGEYVPLPTVVENPEGSRVDIPRKEVFVTRLDIVWNITHKPPVEAYTSTSSSMAMTPHYKHISAQPAGYKYQAWGVQGNKQERLLKIGYDWVSGEQLNNPEFIQQKIAGFYLDWVLVRDYYYAETDSIWPFSEWVPEAEAVRDRIARGEKETQVLPPTPTAPQRPSFLNRILGRS